MAEEKPVVPRAEPKPHGVGGVAILVYIGIRYDASTRILYIQTFIQQI